MFQKTYGGAFAFALIPVSVLFFVPTKNVQADLVVPEYSFDAGDFEANVVTTSSSILYKESAPTKVASNGFLPLTTSTRFEPGQADESVVAESMVTEVVTSDELVDDVLRDLRNGFDLHAKEVPFTEIDRTIDGFDANMLVISIPINANLSKSFNEVDDTNMRPAWISPGAVDARTGSVSDSDLLIAYQSVFETQENQPSTITGSDGLVPVTTVGHSSPANSDDNGNESDGSAENEESAMEPGFATFTLAIPEPGTFSVMIILGLSSFVGRRRI